jgi:hypothetical protein
VFVPAGFLLPFGEYYETLKRRQKKPDWKFTSQVLGGGIQFGAWEGRKVGSDCLLNLCFLITFFNGYNTRFKGQTLTLLRSTFLPFLFDLD